MDKCVDDHMYIIYARNAHVGIYYEESRWFYIARYKFGWFIDTENHWDTGEPHGTAKPLKDLGAAKIDYKSILEHESGWVDGGKVSDLLWYLKRQGALHRKEYLELLKNQGVVL